MTRRVLVTGGNGFIGKEVLALVSTMDWDIYATTRDTSLQSSDWNWIECDLLNSNSINEMLEIVKPDYLMHLAWVTEHGKYWNSPVNYDWLKQGKYLVDKFLEQGGKNLLVAGTCAEYDWQYGYCVEDVTPLNPATDYGIAKDALRRATARVCALENTVFSWCRIFNIYGPGENTKRLMPSIIKSVQEGIAPACTIGTQYRDFIYSVDAARAMVHLLDNACHGEFNISTGKSDTIGQCVNKVIELMGSNLKANFGKVPRSANDPDLLVGSNEKLLCTGWKPQYNLSEGLQETINKLQNKH